MSDEIVCFTEREEREYQSFLEQLNKDCPLVSGKGLDFNKISPDLYRRTARAKVLHLACVGYSVADLAEILDAPIATIQRYLDEALVATAPEEDVEAIRKHELRKLDVQEKYCHTGMERSFQDEETITETKEYQEGEDGDQVPFTVVKRVRKGQSGNPAWQSALDRVAKRRAALQGLDKPAQLQIDKQERKLIVNEVVVRSREDVEKLQALKSAGLLK